MARIIALMALITLGSSGEPFHEPFHGPTAASTTQRYHAPRGHQIQDLPPELCRVPPRHNALLGLLDE